MSWIEGHVRHCGLLVSTPAWDGTGCEFDSWQCRIYIPCSLSLRLLGSLRGSPGTYGLTQKIVFKKKSFLGFLAQSCNSCSKLVQVSHNSCYWMHFKFLYVYRQPSCFIRSRIFSFLMFVRLLNCKLTIFLTTGSDSPPAESTRLPRESSKKSCRWYIGTTFPACKPCCSRGWRRRWLLTPPGACFQN